MPRLMRGTARRGMTLPEVVIAIVMLAIVGTGLTRVLIKQQQVYKDASLTAVSKRELRLGASVLPGELRSISSSGGDIIAMSDGEITMRAYTGSSIVCARTATDEIWLPPTNLSQHTLTSFVTPPLVGDTIFIYNEDTEKGSEDDNWRKFAIADITTSNVACLGAPYTDPVNDPPASKPRIRIRLDANMPAEILTGAVVRFSRPVRYKIYQETSGNWYLGLQHYTGGAWGVSSPMAGPYRSFVAGDNGTTGLQFRYYDSLGTRITAMTNTLGVARADVYLRTHVGTSSIKERNGATLRDSVLMRVAIRNFK
jgi:prepilin-type N-terminal cleavage/methylation domain-containing protein